MIGENSFVLPGTVVAMKSEREPGYGVTISDRGDKLIATRVGYTRSILVPGTSAGSSKLQISVIPSKETQSLGNDKSSVSVVRVASDAPQVSDWVIARVTRLQQSQVNMEILQIDPNSPRNTNLRIRSEAFKVPYKAVLRSYDVRSTERDRVKVEELFRPGDIVRAEVISLGDAGAYFLMTARSELGVLSALSSQSGSIMIPISWEEMISPVTFEREKRKVAKPLQLQ